LPSRHLRRIVVRMRLRRHRGVPLAIAAVLALSSACSEPAKPIDWRNRELPWKYGPTTGTASATHLEGTGTKGRGPVAKGWKLHLQDGKQLQVVPFEPSDTHALFGRTRLAIGVFDQAGKELETVVTGPLAKDQLTFALDVAEDTAKRAWDAILWFRDQ
jgi:hypothetical protein